MSMDTKEDIIQDLKKLETRLDKLKSQKAADKLNEISNRLQSTAAQMQHDQKAAAFLQYKESEAYVLSLKSEIEQSGTIATDTRTTVTHKVKMAPDRAAATTFAPLPAGSVQEIDHTSYLVTSYDYSPAGSKATLIPLNSKYQAAAEPVTPYSQQPCSFDHRSKTLIVAPADRLQPGQQVIINGVKYAPINQIGVDPACYRYELQEVQP